jgi:hypothetical protein
MGLQKNPQASFLEKYPNMSRAIQRGSLADSRKSLLFPEYRLLDVAEVFFCSG